MSIIVLIIILGAAAGLITFFVITSVPAPKGVTTCNAMVERGRTTQACRTAETIMSRQPRDPDARCLRGPARLALIEAESALMEFRIANDSGQFEDDVRAAPPEIKITDLPAEFNLPSQLLEKQLIPIPANAGAGSADR
ncbi:MAG: hypothetical protein EA384_12925 [Spirochaetaceae bacterium]|nr:MAG: hypothetical protein EA384_12925 [Spirochaetaceae bacterium]